MNSACNLLFFSLNKIIIVQIYQVLMLMSTESSNNVTTRLRTAKRYFPYIYLRERPSGPWRFTDGIVNVVVEIGHMQSNTHTVFSNLSPPDFEKEFCKKVLLGNKYTCCFVIDYF